MDNRKRASFFTVGCKLNQYETEAFKEQFRKEGYEIVPFGQQADVVVVNTCTVTGKGARSSRQALRKAIRSSPSGIVVAVGCYAQVFPDQLASIPGIDLIVGTSQKGELAQLVRERQLHPKEGPLIRCGEFSGFDSLNIAGFDGRTRAFVKIQDGCDQRCAYCIVPLARGPSRSRPLDDALQQVTRLVNQGCPEVVLTGVCLGAYGLDLSLKDSEVNLTELLRRLEKLQGLSRYRLSSIEPNYFSEELVSLLAGSAKFCHHLHIPLQSGNTEILRRMGRPYSAKEYEELIWDLKTRIPDMAIGADVIVGFPGETDEDFQSTYTFIQKLPLSYLHVFRFSPRKGTAAYQMKGQIDDGTKKLRSQSLRRLAYQKRMEFISSFIGWDLPVVFETRRDKETGLLTGLSGNYIRVLAEGPDKFMGRIVKVNLEKVQGEKVIGKIKP